MFMESYGAPQARALTRASRAFYSAPPAGFNEVPILAPRGVLYVAWQGQQAALDALFAELQATGSPVHRVDATEVLERVPVLRGDGLIGAIAEPEATDIDVYALHQGYLRAFRHRGGMLWCNAELQRAAITGGYWTITLADGRAARARTLVNAAGAWADTVAERCSAACSPSAAAPSRSRRRRASTRGAGPRWPTWARPGTSSPTPANCWARRPMPTRWPRTT
jgi:D-arginine dehydrogenase